MSLRWNTERVIRELQVEIFMEERRMDNHHNERYISQEYVKLFVKLYNGMSVDRSIFRGHTYMVCVLLGCTGTARIENPQVLLLECLYRQLGELDNCQFRKKGSQYSFLLSTKTLELFGFDKKAVADMLSGELKKSGLKCAFLFDSYIFEHGEHSFREDLADHKYAMLTELFFSGGEFMDYCPERFSADRGSYPGTRYLEQIRQHISMLDRNGIMHAVEELAEEVLRKHTGIQYIQEIDYRIYYLLVNEISKFMESDIEEPLIKRPEWLDAPYFITFPEWKRLLRSMVTEGFDIIEKCCYSANTGICKKVIDFIHRHYMEQISLKQIADLFFINAAYLGRLFQKTTGMSFKEYVNKIRIAEAKKLLLQTDMLVYEIANHVGFTESSYFILKFSQEVGKSPTEYREGLICKN